MIHSYSSANSKGKYTAAQSQSTSIFRRPLTGPGGWSAEILLIFDENVTLPFCHQGSLTSACGCWNFQNWRILLFQNSIFKLLRIFRLYRTCSTVIYLPERLWFVWSLFIYCSCNLFYGRSDMFYPLNIFTYCTSQMLSWQCTVGSW